MKASSRIRQLLVAEVGRVKHSKIIYISGIMGDKIYVESSYIPALIKDLEAIKKVVEENG